MVYIMSNEQRAHDLAIAVVINRGAEAHIDAHDEYLSAYKTILHERQHLRTW